MKTNFFNEPVKELTDDEIATWINSRDGVTFTLVQRFLGVGLPRIKRVIRSHPELINNLHYRARRVFESERRS